MAAIGATAARVPADEQERLADLYAYEVLDSDPEEEFDDIVRLASSICGTPWARVNFVDADRQWTKAVVGMERDEVAREEAFCSHTIVAPDGRMIVPDALEDLRFRGNPLVVDDPGIRFYAGSAIRSSAGRPVGAVCVLDNTPRTLDEEQLEALDALSKMATRELELRQLLSRERSVVEELRELDRRKAEFAATVAHDFRTPLTAIRGFAQLVRDEKFPVERAFEVIERSSNRLLRLVDNVAGAPRELQVEELDLAEIVEATVDLVRPAADRNDVEVQVHAAAAPMRGDAHWLGHVAENLIGNAVKYSPQGTVSVDVHPDGGHVVLEVCDTGVGIPEDELPKLFDPFFRASTSDSFTGTGLGLSIVREVVEGHGGTIGVESAVGSGSTFRVVLPAGG